MAIYSLSPADMVNDQLNRANSPIIAFDSSNLTFGKPVVLTNNPEADTQLAVRGVQGEDYRGQLVINYDRLDLGVLFRGNFRPAFEALGQSNLYRLLPELNKALGMNFTDKDLVDVDLKLLEEGDQVTLELTAKPGSLVFKGSTRVLFNRRQLMLNDVMTVNVVQQFNHADPVLEGYQSAGLLTWGQDFTLISQWLKVNRYGNNYKGSWVDQTTLQQKLAEFYGIESWPNVDTSTNSKMTIKDYATKDHPDANRNFGRVVVQTYLRANGYSGTAFFHYNV